MDRLTSERCNGIKTGYWSPAKKDDLVQRLGAYEDTGLEPEEIKAAIEKVKQAEVDTAKKLAGYIAGALRDAWEEFGVNP